MNEPPDGDLVSGCSPTVRVTSKFRGLYFDSKHASWRVRIFFLGKQRHIGRYKDETLAAQAYDRAAYHLYGTRANLNIRLKDVLADPQDVPASIKQAKEQAMCGNAARPFMTTASSNSSSSSSTCSYSPHHTAQSLGGTQQSPAAGAHFQTPGVYLQQQQLAYHAPVQQMMQQQGLAHGGHMNATVAWPQGMQQQLAAGGMEPVHISAQVLAHHHSLPRMQQQQLLPSAGLLMVDGMRQQPQQQQQLTAPGAVMPDLVASVIAALDLPTHSAALAPNTSNTSFGAWSGANSSSVGLAGAQLAGAAAGPDGTFGVPQDLFDSGPGMVRTHDACVGASMPAGWMGNVSAAPSHMSPVGAMGSYQQHQGLSAGPAGGAAGQVVSVQYLDGSATGNGFMQQQQQQGHLTPEQQLQLQLQSQSLSATGPQHVMAGAQGGLVLVQQGGIYDGMQAGIPVVVQGPGVVMNGAQLSTAVSAGWPQQSMVLSAATL